MKLTLNDIRKHNPCISGFNKLVCSLLGIDEIENSFDYIETDYAESFSLECILDSNGINDAIWSIRCLSREDSHKFKRFMVDIIRLIGADLNTKQKDALKYADMFIDGTVLYNQLMDCKDDIYREYTESFANPDISKTQIWVTIYNLIHHLYDNSDVCYGISQMRGQVLRYNPYLQPAIEDLFKKYALNS
ncbi:MAG: hypothetical protein ACRC3J_05160 [Culicoidibacterales bacterium]